MLRHCGWLLFLWPSEEVVTQTTAAPYCVLFCEWGYKMVRGVVYVVVLFSPVPYPALVFYCVVCHSSLSSSPSRRTFFSRARVFIFLFILVSSFPCSLDTFPTSVDSEELWHETLSSHLPQPRKMQLKVSRRGHRRIQRYDGAFNLLLTLSQAHRLLVE
jgi:hypothetical protein